MNNSVFLKWILAVCAALGSWWPVGAARADVLLDNTSLIGAPSVAPPAEFAFTTTAAEALTVTLTDLQAPAAFGSLQIAVTLGDTLVGSASIDSNTHKATVAIPAGIGNYTLRVIGAPVAAQNSTLAVGSFGARPCSALLNWTTRSNCLASVSAA